MQICVTWVYQIITFAFSQIIIFKKVFFARNWAIRFYHPSNVWYFNRGWRKNLFRSFHMEVWYLNLSTTQSFLHVFTLPLISIKLSKFCVSVKINLNFWYYCIDFADEWPTKYPLLIVMRSKVTFKMKGALFSTSIWFQYQC